MVASKYKNPDKFVESLRGTIKRLEGVNSHLQEQLNNERNRLVRWFDYISEHTYTFSVYSSTLKNVLTPGDVVVLRGKVRKVVAEGRSRGGTSFTVDYDNIVVYKDNKEKP